VEKDNVHSLTTTIQGRCALATDTPPPMVVVILRRDNQPLGAPVLQAIEESQTSTELLDVNEGFKLNLQ
jgi:hypothetical protein